MGFMGFLWTICLHSMPQTMCLGQKCGTRGKKYNNSEKSHFLRGLGLKKGLNMAKTGLKLIIS